MLAFLIVPGFGCGGSGSGGGAAPAAPSQPAALAAGARLTFVSGETGQPVGGAAVTIAGKAYTTTSAGEIAVADPVAPSASLDVTRPDFLDRHTLIRTSADTRFTLWPKASPTGLDEDFSVIVAYTPTNDEHCEWTLVGETRLDRLSAGTTRVYVEVSPEIADDPGGRPFPPAMRAHEDGIQLLNDALGGRVTYILTTQAPANEFVFKARVDPTELGCQVAAAFFDGDYRDRYTIVGGSVVYCDITSARNSHTVAHEFGHSFGLRHSRGLGDIMVGSCAIGHRSSELGRVFSAREALLMALMLQRRPGNHWPDDDRTAPATTSAASSTTEVRRTVCAW